LNRESIGTAALEVLNDLRRKDNDYSRLVASKAKTRHRDIPQHAIEIELERR
jgi:hypothetical protein